MPPYLERVGANHSRRLALLRISRVSREVSNFIKARLGFKESVAPLLLPILAENELWRGMVNDMNPNQEEVLRDAVVTYAGIIVYGRRHDEHLIPGPDGEMYDIVADHLRRRMRHAGTATNEEALQQIGTAESLAQVSIAMLARNGQLPPVV